MRGRIIVVYSPVSGKVFNTTVDEEPVDEATDKKILSMNRVKTSSGATVPCAVKILNSWTEMKEFESELNRMKGKRK